MPDSRGHRGPHPEDGELFDRRAWEGLRSAVADYSWLLSRGYAPPSAIKVVGDRYALNQRQRMAVVRGACTDAQRDGRASRRVGPEQVRGQPLAVDGFNVVTTVEVALGGGAILSARDGTYRDIASVHGTYRRVEETRPALDLTLAALAELSPSRITIYLDSPVGNSGRLAALIRDVAGERKVACEVRLVVNPDAVLIASAEIVATADSVILDASPRWFNLARHVVDVSRIEVTPVPLGE